MRAKTSNITFYKKRENGKRTGEKNARALFVLYCWESIKCNIFAFYALCSNSDREWEKKMDLDMYTMFDKNLNGNEQMSLANKNHYEELDLLDFHRKKINKYQNLKKRKTRWMRTGGWLGDTLMPPITFIHFNGSLNQLDTF